MVQCYRNPCVNASAVCGAEGVCVVGAGTERDPEAWKDPGKVEVHFDGASIPEKASMRCSDSARTDVKPVVGGAVTFTGLSGSCTLQVEGVSPFPSSESVERGSVYACTLDSRLDCKRTGPAL
jgi:hypothetical protein